MKTENVNKNVNKNMNKNTKKRTNIFIKNVYYMLAYAFRSLSHPIYEEIAAEPFEDIYNLFAAIFAKGVGKLLKQGMYREYFGVEEDTPVMHGKINIQGTIRNRAACKQALKCEYDERSENHLYHQIIKTTMLILLEHTEIDKKYANELKRELLYFSGVNRVKPSSIKWSSVHFQSKNPNYNQTYRLLLGICRLVMEGMLMTTDEGTYQLASFVDEQQMSRLYEKFIFEYYSQKFPSISVRASQIPWALDNENRRLLPVMQTDITLQKDSTVLIIDAKYYSHTTQMHYDVHTLHSGNLYQIFTYVKNRDYQFGNEQHTVSGMLLYARTDEDIQPDAVYQMHGNQITVKTLDLNQEFSKIEEQLCQIVEEHLLL